MENLLERYSFKFDKNNSNTILIYEGNKLINMISCPPIRKGIDIINIFNEKTYQHYHYDFGGFILITTPLQRNLYYKGDKIASTMRISEKVIYEWFK